MSYEPCRNPSCKSYGHPHPNCRCYGGMARGGPVMPFCAEDRPHKRGCKYFAEGGAASDEVNQETVIPDEEPLSNEVNQASVIPDEVNQETVIPDESEAPKGRHDSLPQQALTYYEGVGRGFAGPLAPGAELGLSALGVPGLSAEDQKGRQSANPNLSAAGEAVGFTGSMAAGIGEVGLAAKGAVAAAKYLNFGKFGTAALKNGIQGAVMAAGDETTKAMLGQGDPEAPVSSALLHIGAGGLFNMGAAGAFHLTGKAIAKGAAKIPEHAGDYAQHILAGFGLGSQGLQSELGAVGVGPKVAAPDLKKIIQSMGIEGENLAALEKGYKIGQDFVGSTAKKVVSTITRAAGAITGTFLDQLGGFGFWLGERAGAIIGKPIAEGVSPAMKHANQYIYPAIAKILESGKTQHALAVLDYAKGVAKGAQSLNAGVGTLFNGSGQAIGNGMATEANRSKLRDYMEGGGVTQELQETIHDLNAPNVIEPHFAEGGDVAAAGAPPSGGLLRPNGIDQVYPAQNILMNAAKGRVSNYLSSMRPMAAMGKMPFDTPRVDHQKERSYRQAIDIALDPMSVLGHVQKGTLESAHVKHLAAMYPEVHSAMAKKVTEKVLESQMAGTRPSAMIRQGLSLLLGSPLSSDMTPASIQAAQAVFANQKQARAEAQGKPAKPHKESKTGIAQADESYRTTNQAATARSQRGS